MILSAHTTDIAIYTNRNTIFLLFFESPCAYKKGAARGTEADHRYTHRYLSNEALF
ncbi:MAG: hypothetical protein BSOLF_2120 [Candidatus Carbobacillus altaicus]|uniref:Uncharacterized protein n=1 Tax=Candidatus Carbonibacillus altaicus TaxID=2163959 RepID=A0A2R6XYB5_9BACL|nr:MAG: hypothetical protein BSOLF_2120 [Candidatus Carbobacillus altaicus]